LVLAATASPAYAQCIDVGPCGRHAPEMDPQTAAGALALLSGGVLLLTDRFYRLRR
jgi:hypothetical protein